MKASLPLAVPLLIGDLTGGAPAAEALLGDGFTGRAGGGPREGRLAMGLATTGLVLGTSPGLGTVLIFEFRGAGLVVVGVDAVRLVVGTSSPFAKLARFWLARVGLGPKDARPLGAGLALKSRFELFSSSSRLRRSSRCALRCAETASPGRVKVERVGALPDLVGMKGALWIEETRALGLSWVVEVLEDEPLFDVVFAVIAGGGEVLGDADFVVLVRGACEVETFFAVEILAPGLVAVFLVTLDAGVVRFFETLALLDFEEFDPHSCDPLGVLASSLSTGSDSICSIASFKASIASTLSSIRVVFNGEMLVTPVGMKESSTISSMVIGSSGITD